MKVVILGCKHMHVHAYVQNLNQIEDINIVGLFEEDKVLGAEFASNYGIEYFESIEQLLSMEAEVALICCENAKHREMAVAAARSKKHVIVEKPIATTIEDAQQMIDECSKNNVKLMVAFPVRYAPSILRAKQLIDDGELGDIIAIAGTNHGTMPGGWFVDPAMSGGGAVMDHTVHVGDLMHWMLKSEIKDVYCKMGTKIHDIPVEDCALISMEFQNGTYATLDASWNRPEAYPTWGDVTMEIIGTKGTLNVDAFAQHGMLYSNQQKYSDHVNWGNDMNRFMLQDFIRCIKEDLPSPITGEDGAFALSLALMAYRSAKTNAVVTGL